MRAEGWGLRVEGWALGVEGRGFRVEGSQILLLRWANDWPVIIQLVVIIFESAFLLPITICPAKKHASSIAPCEFFPSLAYVVLLPRGFRHGLHAKRTWCQGEWREPGNTTDAAADAPELWYVSQTACERKRKVFSTTVGSTTTTPPPFFPPLPFPPVLWKAASHHSR